MNPLSGVAGVAVDRMLGIRSAAVRYAVRPDVAVEMTDGVVLRGDLYRPAGEDRPLPVVLIRSPYGRAGLPGMMFAAPLARRGFQVFIQSTRGTFGPLTPARAMSTGRAPTARNFGTGQPFATATTAVRCRFEIYHDARHPACVLLPVLPGPDPA